MPPMSLSRVDRLALYSADVDRVPRPIAAASTAPPTLEAETQPVSLSHYLWVLRRHVWRMLAFVLICLLGTYVVSSRLRPVYEATARVDVDRRAPAGVVGQEASQLSSPNDSDQFITTQMELIQSDGVLRPVAARFDLLRHENQLKNADSEKTKLILDAPVLLKNLKITRPPNSYILRISYRSPNPALAAAVANAVANSYLEQTYNLRIKSSLGLSTFMEKQIDELRAKMERSGQALAKYERDLNVINPEEKTNILSARLLQLNTEYTNAQGDRVRKEAAFRAMKSGSLAAAQVSGQGEALVKLAERLNEAQEKMAEVKITFGANHSEYRRAAAHLAEVTQQFESTKANIQQRIETDYSTSMTREKMLHQSVTETKAEFDRINGNSFEYQQLKREAEADKKLYDELIRKIKEAGINAGFQNSSIRVADLARPPAKPVSPDIPLNLMMAFLVSSVLAIGAAILSDQLDNTVRDPEDVSRMLRLDVLGSLPAVRESLAPGTPSSSGQATTALAVSDANAQRAISTFEEAIRTLRNSILLSDFDRRIHTLLITSAAPGEGKSTTVAHLGIAHAQQGKKTLIIDADLRRPTQHQRFGLPSTVGLSDVLTGAINWQDAIRQSDRAQHLDLIPAGPPSRRASDLIGPRLEELLDAAAKEYDLILIDAPPVLGFAESLQIASLVDGVVVVARAGATSRRAVSSVVTCLQRVRAEVLGLVLNRVRKDTSSGYYYYGEYRKYYRTAPEANTR